MKMNLVRAALACCALTLAATQAAAVDTAQGKHAGYMWQGLAGINVSVSRVAPDGAAVAVSRESTDAKGKIVLKGLAPGDYEVDIDGPSLVAAMDTVVVVAERKAEDSPVSVSIGGGLFGGSKQSKSETNGHPGMPGGSSHDNPSSGGGVGASVSVPVGGGEKAANDLGNLGWTGAGSIGIEIKLGPLGGFSSQASYCRDSASHGLRIGFTVPEGGGPVSMEFDIQAMPIAVSAKQ
jgi:hypothetical protein